MWENYHYYKKIYYITMGMFSVTSVCRVEEIIIENLTPHQLHAATYNISTGKRSESSIRTVPPSGITTMPQPSSSFFATTTFALMGATDFSNLSENIELIPYAYSIVKSGITGKKTQRIMLEELGNGIGATSQEGTDTISVMNTTDEPVYIALYYDDGKKAYRWGRPREITAQKRISLQRPERKCMQEQLGICTKFYDRNIYFSTSEHALQNVLPHKKLSYINAGGLKGNSFVIYEVQGTLKGALELTWKAEKTGHKVAKVLKPDIAAIKKKYDTLNYPGKHKVATVREGSTLSDQETSFRLKRTIDYVRPACKTLFKKIYDKELPPNVPVPTIALCVSGGGCRAMFVLAGILAALEQTNFMPFVSYIATLSGSTWALASWLYYGKSAQEHRNYLCKQFTSGIWMDFDILQVQEAVLKKQAYGQPQSIIDIYGALLGDKLFKPYAPHNNPNELFWGQSFPQIDNAQVPFPIYTAVTPRNFSDLLLSSNPFDYYHWLTFDPYEVSITNKSIPSWSFGRFFSHEASSDLIPPCSPGYLLGMFGSAMSINTQDVGNVALKSIKPQYADNLLAITSQNKTLSLLMQQRASPAKVPNFLADGLMTIVDAGIELILPFPPLLKRERTVDIIISIDASVDAHAGASLSGLRPFLHKNNIEFPELNLAAITKASHSVIWDKSKAGAPMLIHIPLVKHKGYENNWDPEKSIWLNTLNFIYSEKNAKKLTGLSQYMFTEAHEAIEKAVADWLQHYAAYAVALPTETTP